MIFRGHLRPLLVWASAYCLAARLGAAPVSSSDDNQKVIEVFRAAQQDMQAGRIESAIQGFKKVLQLEPGLVEARANLGLAYNAAGDYEQAATELSAAAKQRPDLLPASLFLGISYLKLGSPEKAIAPLNHALALDASNQDARSALASAELSEEKYGKAAVAVSVAFFRAPDNQSRTAGLVNRGTPCLPIAVRQQATTTRKSGLVKLGLGITQKHFG
jgi:tetratricopeptide (TPR) repeat protein